MSSLNPFHLAIPVKEITETRFFYRDILGCEEGRSSDHWVDFNFFGHQLVLHIDSSKANILNENSVDGKSVPVPHFGVHLDRAIFDKIRDNLKTNKIKYLDEPYTRFKNKKEQQETFFIKDPHGNILELKTLTN